MSGFLIDEIDVECPYCNKEFSISVDLIGNDVICPYCQKSFSIEDDGFSNSVDHAEELIDDVLDNLF